MATNDTRICWDEYFMCVAKILSLRSTCNSRPGGAVIVKDKRIIAAGYVGSVQGASQCSDNGPDYCYRRNSGIGDSAKYNACKSIHAEQNAILQAACYGPSVSGSVMYCTLQPCYICLKSIARVGIKTVYYELEYSSVNAERDASWADGFREFGVTGIHMSLSNKAVCAAMHAIEPFTSKRRLRSE